MSYESPDAMMRRLKLGREEFCQRLLTILILGGPYPKWNSRNEPAPAGAEFLKRLHALSFGDPTPPPATVFVDEFEMPARHDAEMAGWPDYAVLWDDRVWVIELKTEAASHRPTQLPLYLEQARHHYPAAAVDLTYVTPPLTVSEPSLGAGQRYAHVSWDEIGTLVSEVWADDRPAAVVRDRLVATIEGLERSAAEWRALSAARDALDTALDTARATAADHTQRGIDVAVEDAQALEDLRLRVRQACLDDPALERVRPWRWYAATSTGTALTAGGREHGIELRVSYYV